MHNLVERTIRKLKSILIKIIPHNTFYKPKGIYSTINEYVASNQNNAPAPVCKELYAGYDAELGVSEKFYADCPPYTRQPLQAYVPPAVIVKVINGRLLTDKIISLAIITHDNKLLGNVSYQWGKQKLEDNAVLKQKYFTHPKKYNGTAFQMLVGGGGINNYFHWLFDVLPRIHLLKKSGWYDRTDWFIIPSYKRKYQQESLQLLGIDKTKIIEGDEDTHIQTDILLATTHVRHNSYIPVWACGFLRNHFPATVNPGLDDDSCIYISRKDASFRYVLNETELIATLKKYGFKIIESAGLSFQEQINLFASARIIITTHGAGLANIVFCKKGTTIIELFSQDFVVPLYYDLANKAELKYNYLVCQSDTPAANVAQGIRQNMMVDLYKLRTKLDSLLTKQL